MERLNHPTAGPDEREQRERLEQVQMELRVARATLATTSADVERAEQALRDAILEATVRRDDARKRAEALRDEKRALVERLEELEPRVLEKRKEAEVLARGAALRDRYVDWRTDARSGSSGLTAGEVRVFGGIAVAAFLFLMLIIFLASR